MIVVDL